MPAPISPTYANSGRNLLPLSKRKDSIAVATGSNSGPILDKYLFSLLTNSLSA